ncbi:MAG: HAD-IC family P-type ATPase, partial [Patescibacteria group bacterium]|nr:HAD-IC family P-type ATPase [Patescibacteria group bacterium]
MHVRLHGLFHKKHFRLGMSQDLKFDVSAVSENEIYSRLKTSREGLSDAEARRRLFRYGKNEAARREKRKLLHEIYVEFANPLIILLLVLGTFSLFFSDKFSAVIIYVMAAMSGLLSFFQEHRAEKAVEKLNALVRVMAAVLRNGQLKELKINDLVPGDVVSLSAGDIVPADLRLVSSNDLFVSESSLTGESLPVEKFSRPVDEARGFLKAHNLLFTGSSVVSGTGSGVVFHTGSYTEFGKISDSLSANPVETGFDRGIKDFTWLMIKAILSMVAIILAINLLDRRDFFDSLLFALAVAVGLAPETLPMIVTVNLSKGALDMSKKKVVVKRLDAIQNFGAMDIL